MIVEFVAAAASRVLNTPVVTEKIIIVKIKIPDRVNPRIKVLLSRDIFFSIFVFVLFFVSSNTIIYKSHGVDQEVNV